jgi:hypothetical protein
MNPFLKAMQPKKKRPVDPNAPPRPNLLSHEKTLKEMNMIVQQQAQELVRMKYQVEELERKLARQTHYLSAVHQRLQK